MNALGRIRAARLLAAAALAACADGSGPVGFGTLRGVVIDGTTGSTVAGATVAVGERSATSASDGAFTFDRMLPGRYELTATLGDFAPFADSVTVASRQTTTLTVHLLTPGFLLAAPDALGASPGPIPRSITLTWTPIAEAVNYAVYWSTSPTVAPRDGNRIGRVISPFVHRELTPGETYYYAVAAIGVLLESPVSATVSSGPDDGLSVRVESPETGAFVAPDMTLTVWANSVDADVTSVVASVGAVSVPLTFDATFFRWRGTMTPPPAEGPDVPRLTIIATDANARTAHAMLTLRRVGPPTSASAR